MEGAEEEGKKGRPVPERELTSSSESLGELDIPPSPEDTEITKYKNIMKMGVTSIRMCKEVA